MVPHWRKRRPSWRRSPWSTFRTLCRTLRPRNRFGRNSTRITPVTRPILANGKYGDVSFYNGSNFIATSTVFDFIFKNWSTIELTKQNDYIKLSSSILNAVLIEIGNDARYTSPYYINGIEGVNTIDYSSIAVSGLSGGAYSLVIDFTSLDVDVNRIINAEVVNVANTTDRFVLHTMRNFNVIKASLSNNVFYPSFRQSYEFISANAPIANTVTELNYSKINKNDGQQVGFLFEISSNILGTNDISVSKDIRNGYRDIVKQYGNITKIVGTDKNDTFIINSFLGNKLDIDGGDGLDKLILSGVSSNIAGGVVIDLAGGTLSSKAGVVLAKIKNFEDITGTNGDDVFKITESFFSSNGSTVNGGNGGDDELYLFSNFGSKFSINTNTNQIQYLYDAVNNTNPLSYLQYYNIKKLFLGDGDDELIVGGVGLTYIDGGRGVNSLSFRQLNNGISGFIDNIDIGSDAKVILIYG